MSKQLDYAPRRAIFTRKFTRRLIVYAVLIALAIAASLGWRNIKFYFDQARLLYAQRAWLNFSAPPDRVVYDDDPTLASGLLVQPQYVQLQYPHSNAVVWNHRARNDLWVRAIGKGLPAAGLLFMHERFTPAGERFILTCEIASYVDDAGNVQACFELREFRPATWHTGISMRNGLTTMALPIERAMSAGQRVRFFAGQPDPRDRTHFTIRYQINGVDGILDGYEGDRTEDANGVPTPGLRLDVRKPK